MISNLAPAFYPLDLTSSFSPYLYDFSQPNHIKNVLDTVTNSQSGSGSVVLKGAQNFLNLGMNSCSYNFLIDFAVSLFPVLAPFAYSENVISSLDAGYFRMCIFSIMKGITLGFTPEGAQCLSLGILGSPCSWENDNGKVTLTPMLPYSSLRAMVFINLAQQLAPAGISVFLSN